MNRRRFIAGVLGWATVPIVALEAPRIFLPPRKIWTNTEPITLTLTPDEFYKAGQTLQHAWTFTSSDGSTSLVKLTFEGFEAAGYPVQL